MSAADVLRTNLGSEVRVLLHRDGLAGVEPSTASGTLIGVQGFLVACDALGNVVLRDAREVTRPADGGAAVVSSRIASSARVVRCDSVLGITGVSK